MGYKMKKFSGFKNSPAKVSDSEVVSAQRRLNKIEGSYRAPGWQKAAQSINQTLRSGGLKPGGSGKSDVAEDIYDRPAAGTDAGGGTAAGGGGGEGTKSVGSTISDMKSTVGEVKGMMGDVKSIGQGFGDMFKGASKSTNGGGGTGGDTLKRTEIEGLKLGGYGGGGFGDASLT